MPPVNDNLANAILLTGSNVNVSGTTVGSTVEPGESDYIYAGNGDVWYSWVAPATDTLTIEVFDTTAMDGYVVVYTGTAFTNFVQVGYVSVFAGNDAANTFSVTQGTTYYIQVPYSDLAGTIDFNLSIPYTPPAVVSNISPFPITGNNTGSVTPIGFPTAFYNSVSSNFTSQTDGILNLGIDSTFGIAVFLGDSTVGFTYVTPIVTYGYNITIPIFAFFNYTIVIYSLTNTGYGAYTLNANFVSALAITNDGFTNAIPLTGSTFSVSSDNTLATTELYEDPTNYFSLWYAYTPTKNGYLTLTPTVGIPLAFKVYNGTSMKNAAQVAAGNGTFSFGMYANTSYFIAVCSQSSTSYGTFTFTGAVTQQFPLSYIGPQSSPALTFNSNGLNSIVVDPTSQKIWSLASTAAAPVLYYSVNGGNSWAIDRTFPTLAGSSAYTSNLAMYLDENNNIVVMYVINQGSSVYNVEASFRNKTSGIWTDYASGNVTSATNWNFCQGDDGTIHCALGYIKTSVGGSITNIMYCNYKDGVFSTLTPITEYGSNSLQGIGILSIQLVNWQSAIYIFWRGIIDGNTLNGNFNYCQINTASPLIMDAVVAATAWATAKAYKVGDLVLQSSLIYKCLINHSSTVFATNLASGDWVLLSSYTTPTIIPALLNNDCYNAKSDGTNLYFYVSHNSSTTAISLYENFVNITPTTHPFWVGGLQLNGFEIAMNGDMVVYGQYSGSTGLVVMRINGVWQSGNAGLGGDQNANFIGGHTYNFATLGF